MTGGGSAQQSFDPLPSASRANLKRSFPRDFIEPDDGKRPLVQTGTVAKVSIPEHPLPRIPPRRPLAPPNFLSRFPIQLPPSRPDDASPDHLTLSSWNSPWNPKEKENFPRFVSSNFPFIDANLPLFLSTVLLDHRRANLVPPLVSPRSPTIEVGERGWRCTRQKLVLPVLIPVDGIAVGSRLTWSKGLGGK